VADVLIVCVREDEPQAKALAEMFEAAGFSIGGAPSSDAGLRSSGAGLVVWSQASIRSRPFLDAAQRVINARKAIVASLIEPPPPSSIGDSAVFDLSQWDGDPDDPSLDPLFFAVDRMVNAARTSAGGDQDPMESYTPAPRQRTAPPPPPAPQPSYTRAAPPPTPAGDPLGTEAEHWRAIRDSRDPTDFMDYLARYGPTGAFAEVAELRLKQLTSRSEARPAPPPARPAPRLPPRVEMPPTRGRTEAPPPPRRADAPPTRRVEPPRRYERSYERADLRDPPREGGGPLRAFILIALLGGGALAGGLYFGGGMPNFASTPPAQEDLASTAPPPAAYEDEAASPEEIAGVPLSDTTAAPPPRRTEIAARTEAERPAPAPREQEPETPPPPPVTSWSNNSGPGGPVSLRPGESGSPTTTATSTAPLNTPASAPATTQPTSQPVRATPPPPRGAVVWAQRPSARRISELYPSRALREGVGGRVELNCSVRANQSLACSVASESPTGLGFGQAALSASSSYRANPTLSDGSTSNGAPARIVVQFQAPAQ
jgi:protein TonB